MTPANRQAAAEEIEAAVFDSLYPKTVGAIAAIISAHDTGPNVAELLTEIHKTHRICKTKTCLCVYCMEYRKLKGATT